MTIHPESAKLPIQPFNNMYPDLTKLVPEFILYHPYTGKPLRPKYDMHTGEKIIYPNDEEQPSRQEFNQEYQPRLQSNPQHQPHYHSPIRQTHFPNHPTQKQMINRPPTHLPPLYPPQYPNQHTPSSLKPTQPVYQQPGEVERIYQSTLPQISNTQPMGQPMNIDPYLTEPGPILCPHCKRVTGQTINRKIGSTAIGWGVCLWFWSWFFCWVPCAMDGCKDAELICASCNKVKNVIVAPWLW